MKPGITMLSVMLVTVLLTIFSTANLSGQGIGVAARGGTMGVGAEVSLGFYQKFAIRGGFGKMDWDFMPEIPTSLFGMGFGLPGSGDATTTTALFPETINFGADLYLTDNFRVTGGLLLQTGETGIQGTVDQSGGDITIGSKSYSASTFETFKVTLDENKDYIPYASIGLGNHSERGFGLFAELGAAFYGDRVLTLQTTGNGNILGETEFKTNLAEEEASLQQKVDSYLKIWPILSVGFRFSL
ncbi:MAG: hypothetical protein ACJ0RV_00595 [Longimicrobiales bacterium]